MPNNMIALIEGHSPDELGFLPEMIDQDDPRSAAEQFDANYQHGGGWRPMQGFKRVQSICLQYPGDPVMVPIAFWPLRHEMIIVYPHGFVAVFNIETEAFEVARMD